jgi:cytoplasmic iron level regulating protein YaaA (DUF328/UPF0246 family)
VLVLLPPSEGKTVPRRGRALDLAGLSFPELTATRRAVIESLMTVSGTPDALAVLGVPPTLGDDVSRNRDLLTTPTAPAAAVYSGVLYAALGLASLDTAARRRANRWLVVTSALFGAVRPTDRIPAYRLSMKVNLPPLGALAGVWRGSLGGELGALAQRGLVVDCRSSTYAAAWVPAPAEAPRWVTVQVPGATHRAKHTRGLVARHLCEAGVDTRSPLRLADVLAERFDVDLVRPLRAGRPWTLWVS